MKIGFIPIDNRPVCYTLPKLIAEIDESLELFMPERELLGGLKKDADVLALIDWLVNAVSDVDALVISLDTIAYGGLIPSRRSEESFESILARLQKLKNVLKGKKVLSSHCCDAWRPLSVAIYLMSDAVPPLLFPACANRGWSGRVVRGVCL